MIDETPTVDAGDRKVETTRGQSQVRHLGEDYAMSGQGEVIESLGSLPSPRKYLYELALVPNWHANWAPCAEPIQRVLGMRREGMARAADNIFQFCKYSTNAKLSSEELQKQGLTDVLIDMEATRMKKS